MITSEWGSRDLPPGVGARPAQAGDGGTWTSGLSVDGFAALRAAGFEPVGAVMGGTVHHLGRRYDRPYDCGYRPAPRAVQYDRSGRPLPTNDRLGQPLPTSVTITTRSGAAAGGHHTYLRTFHRARRAATERMAAECASLGGDGVVSVRLDVVPFLDSPDQLEFRASGTAVRARGPVRPGRVFLSHVSGQEFGKLIAAGWVPVDLVLGASSGVRHVDERTEQQTGARAPAQEVEGLTDLVRRTRHDARRRLAADVRRSGAEGAVLSTVDLTTWARSCSAGGEDHLVESTFVGTSITAFRTDHQPPRSLPLMRL
ncbi:heavy metal-binding domain-containing protein [Actinomadura kijaniata]|uniref:heavy metal-binding domain-containing protein n=1 Tax=Actinomadura kijaniata TaxID=46161 RepID=UPI0012FBE3B4|nr:heavy metal-binding domain-containing protein [Actinomadura kijaniata]